MAPKSRRRAGAPAAPGTSVEALGNIFGQQPPAPAFGSAPSGPTNNIFGSLSQSQTQPSQPAFGQNASNAQQSNPFASSQPAQQSNGNMFGGFGSNSSTFNFGMSGANTGSNPFSSMQPSQAQNASNMFSTPQMSTPFKGFGASNNATAATPSTPAPFTFGQSQKPAAQPTSPDDSAMLSPPRSDQRTSNLREHEPPSPSPKPPQSSSANPFGSLKSFTPSASQASTTSNIFGGTPGGTGNLFGNKTQTPSSAAPATTNGAPLFGKPLETSATSRPATPSGASFFSPKPAATPAAPTPSAATPAAGTSATSATAEPQSTTPAFSFSQKADADASAAKSNPFAAMKQFPSASSSAQNPPASTSKIGTQPTKNMFGTSVPASSLNKNEDNTGNQVSSTPAPARLFEPATAPAKSSANMFASKAGQAAGAAPAAPKPNSAPALKANGDRTPAKQPATGDLDTSAHAGEDDDSIATLSDVVSNIERQLEDAADKLGLSGEHRVSYLDQAYQNMLEAETRQLIAENSEPGMLQDIMDAFGKAASEAAERISRLKRKFEDEEAQVARKKARVDDSGTSSPAPSTQPRKPLSRTANLVQSIVESQKIAEPSPVPSFKPTTPATAPSFGGLFSAQKGTASTTPTSTPKPSAGLFGISTSSQPAPAKPTGFVPDFGASTSGTVDFGSQFKKHAEDSQRAKRKADDFDSDEDNEEEWEKKDAEEQRAKAEAAAKEPKRPAKKAKLVPGKGFVFEDDEEAPPSGDELASVTSETSAAKSSSSTTNPFAHVNPPQDDDDDDDDGEATPRASQQSSSNGLFGRITKENGSANTSSTPQLKGLFGTPASTGSSSTLFGASTGSASTNHFGSSTGSASSTGLFGASAGTKPAANLFGAPAPSATKTQATDSDTSPGDHTWKGDAESPIRFAGGSSKTNGEQSTPKSGGLFGASDRPFAGLTSTAKKDSVPNLFGLQTSSSKPSTPAPGTPAGSLFAPSPAVSTPGMTSNATSAQASDDDAAPPESQSNMTSLTEAESQQEETLMEIKAKMMHPPKKGSSEWTTVGTGPLRVLKDKTSGTVRILSRCEPRGQVVLNCALQKGLNFSKKQKCAITFALPDASGNPEGWVIRVGLDAKAEELLGVLQKNTPGN